jgi:hypothetical protein
MACFFVAEAFAWVAFALERIVFWFDRPHWVALTLAFGSP